ncbi:carboxylating nicotinate-nucleotide diphosphorylase [Bacteroidota bacterium]
MEDSLTNIKFDFLQAQEIIKKALKEDIGSGDITTDCLIDEDKTIGAYIKTKEDGMLAGLPIAKMVFSELDNRLKWSPNFEDGEQIYASDILVRFSCSYKAALSGERTALNFLQRMSGIATQTSLFVNSVKSQKTKILDTRKTIPGLRLLDKYAVRKGGGTSHRIGLFDMVMIKDNHIVTAGSIQKSVKTIRSKTNSDVLIEVETTNLEEVREALASGADIIMLDNMDTRTIKNALEIINNKARTEASGNISLDRVKEIAECGVDYISIGSLTHSVKALDISLYFDK